MTSSGIMTVIDDRVDLVTLITAVRYKRGIAIASDGMAVEKVYPPGMVHKVYDAFLKVFEVHDHVLIGVSGSQVSLTSIAHFADYVGRELRGGTGRPSGIAQVAELIAIYAKEFYRREYVANPQFYITVLIAGFDYRHGKPTMPRLCMVEKDHHTRLSENNFMSNGRSEYADPRLASYCTKPLSSQEALKVACNVLKEVADPQKDNSNAIGGHIRGWQITKDGIASEGKDVGDFKSMGYIQLKIREGDYA